MLAGHKVLSTGWCRAAGSGPPRGAATPDATIARYFSTAGTTHNEQGTLERTSALSGRARGWGAREQSRPQKVVATSRTSLWLQLLHP